jgi:hypothetical protein
MIADFLATTASSSELIDIVKTALAISGGPKDTLAQLKNKYDEGGLERLSSLRSLAWTLKTNAQQHSFDDKFLVPDGIYRGEIPVARSRKSYRPFGQGNEIGNPPHTRLPGWTKGCALPIRALKRFDGFRHVSRCGCVHR